MPLKTIEVTDWLPDTSLQNMLSIQGMAPTEYGYSGIGEIVGPLTSPAEQLGSSVGTPQAVMRSAYPTGEQLFLGTTGAGTDSHIYGCSAWPPGVWTDRLAAGAANAEWHFLQFGDNTLVAGGTGIRLKVSTVAVPNFTNVTSNISPKFICRFGNRVFAANLSWNIAGITTVATAGTETDYIFASNYNDVGVFGDSASSPGLGAAIFLLRDEYGPITGIAATETYILVTKGRALIIGRRSTAYDIDWNYLGARFGCSHPRSIVVDGEDVYLWSNSGPIRIVAGNEIEQIGNGRISWTMRQPTLFDVTPLDSGVAVALGYGSSSDGFSPVYATQDQVSGAICWHYSPGNVASSFNATGYLDRMVIFDPNTRKLSWADTTSWRLISGSSATALQYKCACPALYPVPNAYYSSPISNITFIDSGGHGWVHYSQNILNSGNAVLSRDPSFTTQWFSGDDGDTFRIVGVYLQFQNFSAFGQISVTIVGISDRALGVEIENGPYTGIDPQGKIDTSACPWFQTMKLKIKFGAPGPAVLGHQAQIMRNLRLVEVITESLGRVGSR